MVCENVIQFHVKALLFLFEALTFYPMSLIFQLEVIIQLSNEMLKET